MDRGIIKGSSNIAEAGYDFASSTLEIKFHNGSVYRYNPITVQEWNAFSRADSKGKYFAQNIRNADGVITREV